MPFTVSRKQSNTEKRKNDEKTGTTWWILYKVAGSYIILVIAIGLCQNSHTSQHGSFTCCTEVAALTQQSTCGDLSGVVQAVLYRAILLATIEVVDKFCKKHPRRMQLDSLLLHWLWYTGIIQVLGLPVIPPIYSPFSGLAVFFL